MARIARPLALPIWPSAYCGKDALAHARSFRCAVLSALGREASALHSCSSLPLWLNVCLLRGSLRQAGRSIEYGETAATLKNEYKYTTHIQNGQNMELDTHIGATHILR